MIWKTRKKEKKTILKEQPNDWLTTTHGRRINSTGTKLFGYDEWNIIKLNTGKEWLVKSNCEKSNQFKEFHLKQAKSNKTYRITAKHIKHKQQFKNN